MRYSKLIWRRRSNTEPAEILSEHDSAGWETRKIEYFSDGSIGFASRTESVGGSRLSEIKRPADDEVNGAEMSVVEFTASEFESAWKQAQNAAVIHSQD